jgi:hypothetical protein
MGNSKRTDIEQSLHELKVDTKEKLSRLCYEEIFKGLKYPITEKEK